jgi:periplasmic copper chaperone A
MSTIPAPRAAGRTGRAGRAAGRTLATAAARATLAVVALAAVACGDDEGDVFTAGTIDVRAVYAAVPANPERTALYLTVENRGGDADALMAVESQAADRAEIHEQAHVDGAVVMREVEAVDIPGDAVVHLEPGGYHIMLMGLRGPLQAGDTVHAELRFRRAGALRVRALVVPYDRLEHVLGGSHAGERH